MAERNISFEGIPEKGKVAVPKKKIQRKKRSDPKFINYLLQCLDTGKHDHMLHYVNEKRKEFFVIYTDKKNKRIWNEKDVSLFKDSNEHLEYKLKRKHNHDKDEDWKTRFRANMNKTFGKYIKEIDSKKISKCKRRVKYEILERPKPLVGKAKNDGVPKRKPPGKKINENKNMKISVREDSQVEFSKSLTSTPQGNRGSLKKEDGSKIVSNDDLEKKETNKVIFNESLEEDIIQQMQFLSCESLEKEIKKDNHYLCLSHNLGIPQFDLNPCDYLLFDGGESLKDNPFFGHMTDKDDENINNIGDESDWHSNLADFSMVEEENVIFR